MCVYKYISIIEGTTHRHCPFPKWPQIEANDDNLRVEKRRVVKTEPDHPTEQVQIQWRFLGFSPGMEMMDIKNTRNSHS